MQNLFTGMTYNNDDYNDTQYSIFKHLTD